ncbi:hypothetical protein SeMB42_g03703 [Synchytrium endobioticum]|uniref:Endonuclease/exonuclease/phosphatase domain-containing protein n=1 Tax=Synchytrium endobioticum TaxID=286115 RepID=A0A507D551_9FUNG|nr:hypothetical protein SeMB42_g03703 [Synchytrium endobioticum]
MISGRNAKPGYRRLTFILVKGISRQSVNQVQKILVMMGLDIANFVTARFQNSDVCELVIYEDAEEEYKRTSFTHRAKFFNLTRAYLNSEIRKLATDKAKETDPAATRATTPKKATTSNESSQLHRRQTRGTGGIALLLGPGNSIAQLRIGIIRKSRLSLTFTILDHIVTAIYLPPEEPISAIKDEFQALSTLMTTTSIILGDFNMGLTTRSDPRSTFLIPLLGSANFARLTTPPTFIHYNQTATTPDQIWIGAHTFKSIEAALTPPFPVITDHQSIILHITKDAFITKGTPRIKEGHQLLEWLERINLTFWPDCDTKTQRSIVNEAQTAITELITYASKKVLGMNRQALKNAYPPPIAKKRQLLRSQQRRHRKHFNKYGKEDTGQREIINKTKKEISEEIYDFHATQPGFHKLREQLENLPNNEVTRIMANIQRSRTTEPGPPLPTDPQAMKSYATHLHQHFSPPATFRPKHMETRTSTTEQRLQLLHFVNGKNINRILRGGICSLQGLTNIAQNARLTPTYYNNLHAPGLFETPAHNPNLQKQGIFN